MPEIRTHPETGKKVIFYSLGEDVPVAAGQQVYTTPNGNYIEIPDTGTQYVEGSYQRKDFTQPQLEASKDILMERGLLPYAAGRTINNLDLARERDRKILYEQSLKRTSPEPQNIANVMLPGGVQGLLGPLVEKVGRRFADTKSAQSEAINQFAAAGQASPSVVPDNRTTPDQLTAIQTYPDTNQFQNVFVNSNEYGNANTLVAGDSNNPFSRSYVAGQGTGISNALRDQGGSNTLNSRSTTSDGPMFRTYGLMNFPSGRDVSGDGSGGGGGMFGVSSVISPNVKKDENQIALDKNQAEVADKVIEQVKTEEAKQGGGKQSSEELEKLKNEILASDVDPYRWQNFFANAAIVFNTLRTPSMRDQQIPAIMADRIKTNRQLALNRSGASSIEAIGGAKAKVIADALRRGAITYDQALTAVYKNESQVKEMLKLMESDPEGFAKIAPYLSGQGYGEMQGVLLKAALKLQEDSRTKAQASADAFSSVERLENILNEFQQSGYSTGEWAETKKNLLSTLAQYGIQINREFLNQATTLEGASNLLVAEELRKNKGPQTDFDALFTSRFVPSLLGRPEANQERIRYLKSKSLVDMMIDEAVQKVQLGASNPSEIQGQISKIMALATNRNMAKVIKISDAKDGVPPRFTSFAEFVDAYRAEEPEAEAVDILNEWMDVVAKARKTFKTGAL